MTERYSYSALSDFRACPLRYRLKRIVGLEPRDAARNAHHLVFGSGEHKGLEILYSGGGYAHSATKDMEAGLLNLAQYEFAKIYSEQLDPADKAKTQENGIRALKLYVDRWREEDRKWRVLSCEDLDSGGDTGLDVMRLDLVAENLEHGGIYGWDHKFTGKALGPWFWDRFNPESQITQYIDRIQERYGSCEGFVINGVSLQWRDALKSDGKTNNVAWFKPEDEGKPWLAYSHYEPREYRGGVLGKKGTYMAAWGLTVGFERQVFNRSKAQIEQERASTKYWIDRIAYAAVGDEYGFNTSSCYSCEYRGGDLIGGICRPGYSWPQDEELILLSYRQVCREVIKLPCGQCAATGISMDWVEDIRYRLTDSDFLALLVPNSSWSLMPIACRKCLGTKVIDGPRCALDKNHVGPHSEESPIVAGDDGVIDVEITVS